MISSLEFTMKKFLYIVFLLAVSACSTAFGRENKKISTMVPDSASKDTTEYDLIINDPGFETWLATEPPEEYLSLNYYETMNKLYVPEWNYRYFSERYGDEYGSYIDYDPRINYGLDLNYKLYYYFKYFEKMNNTKLYPVFR